jgi:hypothetical protein
VYCEEKPALSLVEASGALAGYVAFARRVPGKLTSTMADGPGDGAEVVACRLQISTVNGSFGVLPVLLRKYSVL